MGDLFDLGGKVALITGSSKGIGKAIAQEMARHGARVVISSRKVDVCQEVADAINTELIDQPGGAVALCEARQDLRRERFDRLHERRVGNQAVVGPGEEPAGW